jgi:hypothetical protein
MGRLESDQSDLSAPRSPCASCRAVDDARLQFSRAVSCKVLHTKQWRQDVVAMAVMVRACVCVCTRALTCTDRDSQPQTPDTRT